MTKVAVVCTYCGAASTRYADRLFSVMFCNRSCRTAFRRQHAQAKYKEIVINGRRIYEHRFVMEEKLGRQLLSSEIVHHIDGNGWNNNIDNLEVVTQKEHAQRHANTEFEMSVSALVAEHMSMPEIAKRLDVSYKRVWKAVKSMQISVRKAEPTSKINVKECNKLLQDGHSLRLIGRMVGASHPTVSAALKKRNN